jgi:hypothetical protein
VLVCEIFTHQLDSSMFCYSAAVTIFTTACLCSFICIDLTIGFGIVNNCNGACATSSSSGVGTSCSTCTCDSFFSLPFLGGGFLW